jgi:SAM-dependent methyltransferase
MQKFLFLVISIFLVGCGSDIHPETKTKEKRELTDDPEPLSSLVSRYESSDRVIWQKPDLIVNLLGSLEDKTVVDIGAGSGYFAFRILPSAKKVIAVDIDPRMIALMDSARVKLPEELRNKMELRLAKEDDPLVKKDEVHAAILVNTYMYINDRIKYFKKLHSNMSKGGLLLVIDYKDKNTPVGPPREERLPMEKVIQELKAAGFSKVESDDRALDYQYIIRAQY